MEQRSRSHVTGAGSAFGETVRSAIRIRDCVALGTVPAVLVVLFFLPDSRKLAFAFDYSTPTVTTAYTANVVHLEASHLLANVAGYGLLAGTGYLLAVLTGHRRLFGVAAVTYLGAFPPILSALNLAIPRDALTYGFSGIVMAFAGLLPLLLSIYARRQIGLPLGRRRAPAVFFATLAIIALTAMPPSRTTIGIAVVSAFATLGYFATDGKSVEDQSSDGHRVGRSSGWLELFLVGTALTFAYPLVGFPSTATPDTVVPNLYAHLMGYCLAFIVPYVALESGIVQRTESARTTES